MEPSVAIVFDGRAGLCQDEDGVGVSCIGAEIRPGLLLLAPYAMAEADKALFRAIKRVDLAACLEALDKGADVEVRDGRSQIGRASCRERV